MPRRKIIGKTEKKRQTCTKYLLKGNREQVFQYLGIMWFCHQTFGPSGLLYQPIFVQVKRSSKSILICRVLFLRLGRMDRMRSVRLLVPVSYANFCTLYGIISPLKAIKFNSNVLQTVE